MAEAAEKRLSQQEGRGIKDPEKVKRDRERREMAEKLAEQREMEARTNRDGPTLQVSHS